MAEFKQGWFTRVVRKHLEEAWEARATQLGQVERFPARTEAWEKIEDSNSLSLAKLIQLVHERFNIAEARVLKSNQAAFHKAIVAYRDDMKNVGPQQSFPGFEKKMAEHFGPIADYWIKDPGPDRAFDQLRRIRDLDYVMQYRMTQVREEKSREVMLSREDYEFMETRRQAEGLPQTTTIGYIIALAG